MFDFCSPLIRADSSRRARSKSGNFFFTATGRLLTCAIYPILFISSPRVVSAQL